MAQPTGTPLQRMPSIPIPETRRHSGSLARTNGTKLHTTKGEASTLDIGFTQPKAILCRAISSGQESIARIFTMAFSLSRRAAHTSAARTISQTWVNVAGARVTTAHLTKVEMPKSGWMPPTILFALLVGIHGIHGTTGMT